MVFVVLTSPPALPTREGASVVRFSDFSEFSKLKFIMI